MSANKKKQGGLVKLRQRYVTRACTLLLDPGFRDRMKRELRGWNDMHPRYLVQPAPPDDNITHPGHLPWYPNAIERELSAADLSLEGETPMDIVANNAKAFAESGLQPIWAAAKDWDCLLDVLSCEFWPPTDFPSPGDKHPALAFVSACLLFGPGNLIGFEDRLFPKFRLPVHLLPSDPETVKEAIFSAAAANAQLRVLWAALDELLIGEPDTLAAIRARATTAMTTEVIKEVTKLYNTPLPDLRRYIPLDLGFNASDLEDAASSIAALAESAESRAHLSIDARVRMLRSQGLSTSRIAETLGISDDTVRRILQSSTSTAE